MKLLLDETYPARLAARFGARTSRPSRSSSSRSPGGPTARKVLGQQDGVLIALSSRFSRRPAGHDALVAALLTTADEPLNDRVVFLQRDRA